MLARAVALTRRSRATQLRGRTQITFCVESRRDRSTQLTRSFADAPQHSNSGRCACVGSKALKTDLVRCFAHDAVRSRSRAGPRRRHRPGRQIGGRGGAEDRQEGQDHDFPSCSTATCYGGKQQLQLRSLDGPGSHSSISRSVSADIVALRRAWSVSPARNSSAAWRLNAILYVRHVRCLAMGLHHNLSPRTHKWVPYSKGSGSEGLQ